MKETNADTGKWRVEAPGTQFAQIVHLAADLRPDAYRHTIVRLAADKEPDAYKLS